MIYTFYDHHFDLPGANTCQMSAETWESKKEFLNHLYRLTEEAIESVNNTDEIENGEEQGNRILEDIAAIRDSKNTEDLSLAGFRREYGYFRLEIIFAEAFPDIRGIFAKKAYACAQDRFEEFEESEEDLKNEDYSDYEEDEVFQLWLALKDPQKIASMSQEEFEETFERFQDLFWDDSVF